MGKQPWDADIRVKVCATGVVSAEFDALQCRGRGTDRPHQSLERPSAHPPGLAGNASPCEKGRSARVWRLTARSPHLRGASGWLLSVAVVETTLRSYHAIDVQRNRRTNGRTGWRTVKLCVSSDRGALLCATRPQGRWSGLRAKLFLASTGDATVW